MGLVMPDFGLLFWMVLSFSLLMWLLGKFAWKPILTALSAREDSIEKALKSAELAKSEMVKLQAGNEKLLKEAMMERERIVKEARELKDSIVREAKNVAVVEANKVMEEAKSAIARERSEAVNEMKSVISSFSIEIAEKILKEHLSDNKKQKDLVANYLENIKLN
ncbi:MAG: F0F1 ATP synthase subunit B [Prolixibacteraceae bacterium]|jgi:F-type H+-transporting ATPase subunit b|nr:F0F1 ATP synthase subunit B [Prolixibacteraceae bacterium]